MKNSKIEKSTLLFTLKMIKLCYNKIINLCFPQGIIS